MKDPAIIKRIESLAKLANFNNTNLLIQEIAKNNFVHRKKTIDRLIRDNAAQVASWKSHDCALKKEIIDDYILINKALKLEKKLSWKK